MIKKLRKMLGIGPETHTVEEIGKAVSESREKIERSIGRIELAASDTRSDGLSRASDHLRSVSMQVLLAQRAVLNDRNR
jgi:hypothetical protein